MNKQETLKMLKPCIALMLLTFGVFSLLNYSGLTVFLTLLFGTAYALINFFMIAQATTAALVKPPQKAQVYMTTQYFIRLLITGELIYLAIKIPQINFWAFIVPLFFPKVVIILNSIFYKKGG